jgi:hypothetical protein
VTEVNVSANNFRDQLVAVKTLPLLSVPVVAWTSRWGSGVTGHQSRCLSPSPASYPLPARSGPRCSDDSETDIADVRHRLAWPLTALRHQRARESDLIYEALAGGDDTERRP